MTTDRTVDTSAILRSAMKADEGPEGLEGLIHFMLSGIHYMQKPENADDAGEKLLPSDPQ